MTARVVFIGADPRELAPWVARWNATEPVTLPVHWARRGKWRDIEMIAIANGVGADRACAAARSIANAEQIWSIGFGGAADPSLRIGDVIAGTCVRANGAAFRCERPDVVIPFRAGAVHTIASVAQTAREKAEHRERGASVLDMEAAGVARASLERGARFYCVKAISDLAADEFANDFNAALRANGTFSAARLMRGALERPFQRFPELFELRKQTAFAARNLGEFLAHCEF